MAATAFYQQPGRDRPCNNRLPALSSREQNVRNIVSIFVATYFVFFHVNSFCKTGKQCTNVLYTMFAMVKVVENL